MGFIAKYMVESQRRYNWGCNDMGEKISLPMKKGFGATDRIDAGWKGPTAMAFYLGVMVGATWRGMMEADFWIFLNSGVLLELKHGD